MSRPQTAGTGTACERRLSNVRHPSPSSAYYTCRQLRPKCYLLEYMLTRMAVVLLQTVSATLCSLPRCRPPAPPKFSATTSRLSRTLPTCIPVVFFLASSRSLTSACSDSSRTLIRLPFLERTVSYPEDCADIALSRSRSGTCCRIWTSSGSGRSSRMT